MNQSMENSFSSEDVRDLLSKISKLEEVGFCSSCERVELSYEADGAEYGDGEAQEDAE